MKIIDLKRITLAILLLSGTAVRASYADEHQEFPVIRESEVLTFDEQATTSACIEIELAPPTLSNPQPLSPTESGAETDPLSLVSEEDLVQSTGAVITSCADHWIASFPAPNVIKLGDGTEWTFNLGDSFLIRSWRTGDRIDICPKTNFLWASDYSYVLTNRSQAGSSIDVNCTLGPIKYGRFSAWIRGIDYANRQIYVVTGEGEQTTWVIHRNDDPFFQNLAVNSHVIIMNNGDFFWWFSPFNRILVHVELNQQLHARQL